MNFTILRHKDFSNGKYWLLTELNLFEYVESLSEENFNFRSSEKNSQK